MLSNGTQNEEKSVCQQNDLCHRQYHWRHHNALSKGYKTRILPLCTFTSYHRYEDQNGRWMSSTDCDVHTLLTTPSVRTCCPTQSWTGVCIDGWTYFSTLKTTHLPRGCLRRPENSNTIRYSSASFNTRWSHYRSFWMIVTNDMLWNQISDANLHCVPY